MLSAYRSIKFFSTIYSSRLNTNLTKITNNKLNTKDLQLKDILIPATKKYQIKTHAILGATESHALPIKLNQSKIAINSKNN